MIPDPLHPDTRLLLVSAVYFKGGWENEFEINGTRDEPFYADGGRSQVPLMRDQQGLRHMRGSGYQAVELNYRDSYLSMLVLLPDRRDGLKELEDALTVSLLNQTTRQMELTPVKLSLPRFKFSWGTVDLCSDLDSLGMREAFDRSRADFSGINGHVPPSQDALFIAHVLHQAFVDVNETGTEAAAATAVGMAPRLARSPRPIAVFRADHPFLFALRDRSTDMILFLGRVADPAQT